MAIEVIGVLFGVENTPPNNVEVRGVIMPTPQTTFSQFKINDNYAHAFVSVNVVSCTLKDLNPNVSLRYPDKTLTFAGGSLTANETNFEFGYDASAIVMDFEMNAEFFAGRIKNIVKTNVPVFTN